MKRIACIILALVLVLGLAACGGSKKGSPEAAVDTLMAGIKEFDIKKIQSVLKEQVDEDDLGLDSEAVSPLLDLLKQWSSKTTYKLGKAEVNGEKAKVPVDVTFTDAADLIKAAFTEYFTAAMTKALSGEEVSEEDMTKLLVDTINEKSKTEKPGTTSTSLTLELEKIDGEWKFTDLPDDMMNIMFSNMMSAFEGMFDGLIDLGN